MRRKQKNNNIDLIVRLEKFFGSTDQKTEWLCTPECLNYLKIPQEKPGEPPVILRFNTLTPLGKGSFGSIYRAELVKIERGSNEKIISATAHGTNLVVKRIKKQFETEKKAHRPNQLTTGQLIKNEKKKIEHEASALYQHFKVSVGVESDEHYYLVTEHVPGQNLSQFMESRFFKTLTFSERLQLINEILFELNLIHQNFTKTGSPRLHLDIKPDNILIDVKSFSGGSKKFNARIVDYGCTRKERVLDEEREIPTNGTPLYMAPEIIKKRGSTRSDIFSMTAIAALIIGVPKDVVIKNRVAAKTALAAPKTLFDLSTLTNSKNLALKLTEQFLNKMQSNHFKNRPKIEACMAFFTTMQRYAKERESMRAPMDKINYFFRKLFNRLLDPIVEIESAKITKETDTMREALKKGQALVDNHEAVMKKRHAEVDSEGDIAQRINESDTKEKAINERDEIKLRNTLLNRFKRAYQKLLRRPPESVAKEATAPVASIASTAQLTQMLEAAPPQSTIKALEEEASDNSGEDNEETDSHATNPPPAALFSREVPADHQVDSKVPLSIVC